jgi:hypothetical protein
MSTRRTLLTFGVLMVALAVPGTVLAQADTSPAEEAPPIPASGSVRVSTVTNDFDGLLVSWTAPTSVTDAQGPLTGYPVYYSEATFANGETTAAAKSVDVGATVTTTTLSGLKAGTEYHVAVASMNAFGLSAQEPTLPVTATTDSAPMPDRVTGVEVESGDGELMVKWLEPFAGHSTLTIKAYHVYYRTSKFSTRRRRTRAWMKQEGTV